MSKSYVSFFLGLYDCILADVVSQYPSLSAELGRDIQRLKSVSEKRGVSVFTLDLPAIGRVLENCLSEEAVIISYDDGSSCHYRAGHTHSFTTERAAVVLPLHGRRPDSPFPKLFGGLWALVFSDSDGLLLDNPDVNAIFFLRQLYYAAKKVEMQCSDKATFAAVADFVKIEKEMRKPTNDWEADSMEPEKRVRLQDDVATVSHPLPLFRAKSFPLFDLSDQALRALGAIQLLADICISGFSEFNPEEWSFKHGPGAVADAKKGNKYEFPTWPRKLEQTFASDVFAFANYSDWADFAREGDQGRFSLNEHPSRLISVPKTQKGPRLIASEPTSHQWCQQAIKGYLESSVANCYLASAIDFADQDNSRRAALTASRTGSHATIDLSSASDRLSLWVVERIFRSNSGLLKAFHSARTRWLVNDIDKKQPKYIKLRKFSPQGAAITFPVQTIVYTLIAAGCVLIDTKRSYGRTMVSRDEVAAAIREVRVFGDDIIVPVHITGLLTEVLQYLGLRVNITKSFFKGNFRESCGMDAFGGFDVTPAYIRHVGSPTQPESICSLVACSNNFQKKGLWHAAEFIQKHTTGLFKLKIPVVGIDSGLFGWASFCGTSTTGLKIRWNRNLQRDEHQIHLPFGKVARGVQPWQSTLLQYFTENRPTTSHWTDHLRDPKNWSAGWIAGVTVKLRLRWTAVS